MSAYFIMKNRKLKLPKPYLIILDNHIVPNQKFVKNVEFNFPTTIYRDLYQTMSMKLNIN